MMTLLELIQQAKCEALTGAMFQHPSDEYTRTLITIRDLARATEREAERLLVDLEVCQDIERLRVL